MEITILYASLTGYTTSIVQQIEGILADTDASVTSVDISDLNFAELPNYHNVLFGCSTHGDGDLNPIAEEFFDQVRARQIDLTHFNVAIFGLGESAYPHFCGSVDLAKEAFQSLGANLILPSIKIDMLEYDPEKRERDLSTWLTEVMKQNAPAHFCTQRHL